MPCHLCISCKDNDVGRGECSVAIHLEMEWKKKNCILFNTPIHLSLHMQTAWVAIIKSFGQ